MRVLVLSDIHANLPALEAVLAAAGPFDALWNLGDVVGYGAHPNQVCERMRAFTDSQSNTLHVRGNHDRVSCGLSPIGGFNPSAADAATWTRRALTPENLQWLRELPHGPLDAGHRALVAHGSPLHEDQYIVTMRDAWVPLQRMAADITFFGHTHMQGGFAQHDHEWQDHRPVFNSREGAASVVIAVPEGTRHLINPGSVGQPRDQNARAAYAIYDTSAATVTFHRVPYDIAAAQAAIRAAGLPARLATRLTDGK